MPVSWDTECYSLLSCNSVSKPVKLYDNGKGACWYCRTGNIVAIMFKEVEVTESKEVQLGTLPEELRPSARAVGCGLKPGYDSFCQLTANTTGLVVIYSLRGSGAFSATLAYPIV